MELVTYFTDNPIILAIVIGFLVLMGAMAWGQFQTWRVDNETDSDKRLF